MVKAWRGGDIYSDNAKPCEFFDLADYCRALAEMFGGLIGLALGTMLPRLFTSLAIYPRLTLKLLGPELKPLMFAAIRRNLALCAGALRGDPTGGGR